MNKKLKLLQQKWISYLPWDDVLLEAKVICEACGRRDIHHWWYIMADGEREPEGPLCEPRDIQATWPEQRFQYTEFEDFVKEARNED